MMEKRRAAAQEILTRSCSSNSCLLWSIAEDVSQCARVFLLLKRQHFWMHMSKVLMEGDQLADAAPRRFKDRWQEMDTLKQLAYKTLNMLKLFLIDNFTEKHLHFTPKLSRRLMKNSTNLHLPRSVNNHQGTMVKYSPSSWSWMWQ